MLDEYPMWINMEPAMEEITGYPEAEIDRKVLLSIAGFANSQGVAWPTQRCVAHQTGYSATTVCASTKRLQDKDWLKVAAQKKMKKTDRHPRNIYVLASDIVRETPDMRSNHFDAEKWKAIAARLKKHVSDAVDDMKQVAAGFAQSMSASVKKRQRRAHRTWNRQDYRQNSWNQRSYEEPAISLEERQRQDWINHLIQQGDDALEKADMSVDGVWEAQRYIRKRLTKTPEKYDSILAEAVEKFKDFQNLNCFETRVQLGLNPIVNNQSHSTVSDVRLVSPGNEPMSLGSVLSGALA